MHLHFYRDPEGAVGACGIAHEDGHEDHSACCQTSAEPSPEVVSYYLAHSLPGFICNSCTQHQPALYTVNRSANLSLPNAGTCAVFCRKIIKEISPSS